MAATHETLELGIIPQDDTEIVEDNMNEECKNTEDASSESTPMNTPAINEDDLQLVEPEDIQPDSKIYYSEQGKRICCIDLLYLNNKNIIK